MKVEFTAEAETDLEAIADYIARDNPVRALSFVREIVERCIGLAAMPEAFPLVPRYRHLGIRRRVHGRYLIFYRIEDDRITILHVLNGAMDFEALLFPTGEFFHSAIRRARSPEYWARATSMWETWRIP